MKNKLSSIFLILLIPWAAINAQNLQTFSAGGSSGTVTNYGYQYTIGEPIIAVDGDINSGFNQYTNKIILPPVVENLQPIDSVFAVEDTISLIDFSFTATEGTGAILDTNYYYNGVLLTLPYEFVIEDTGSFYFVVKLVDENDSIGVDSFLVTVEEEVYELPIVEDLIATKTVYEVGESISDLDFSFAALEGSNDIVGTNYYFKGQLQTLPYEFVIEDTGSFYFVVELVDENDSIGVDSFLVEVLNILDSIKVQLDSQQTIFKKGELINFTYNEDSGIQIIKEKITVNGEEITNPWTPTIGGNYEVIIEIEDANGGIGFDTLNIAVLDDLLEQLVGFDTVQTPLPLVIEPGQSVDLGFENPLPSETKVVFEINGEVKEIDPNDWQPDGVGQQCIVAISIYEFTGDTIYDTLCIEVQDCETEMSSFTFDLPESVFLCGSDSSLITTLYNGEYSWQFEKAEISINNEVILSQEGVYHFEFTPLGSSCKVNDSLSVSTVSTGFDLVANEGSLCEGTLLLSTNLIGKGYKWFFNDLPIVGAVSQDYMPLYSGEYKLEILGENCTNISNPILVQNQGLFTVSNDLSSLEASFANSYQWYIYLQNEWKVIYKAQSQTYVPLYNGVYKAVGDINGCKFTSTQIDFSKAGLINANRMSFEELNGEVLILANQCVVMPNPSRDQFEIRMNGVNIYSTQIFDARGVAIYEKKVQAKNLIIQNQWPIGLYHVIIQDEEGHIWNIKMEIE